VIESQSADGTVTDQADEQGIPRVGRIGGVEVEVLHRGTRCLQRSRVDNLVFYTVVLLLDGLCSALREQVG
jgi:hypothetical protein